MVLGGEGVEEEGWEGGGGDMGGGLMKGLAGSHCTHRIGGLVPTGGLFQSVLGPQRRGKVGVDGSFEEQETRGTRCIPGSAEQQVEEVENC